MASAKAKRIYEAGLPAYKDSTTRKPPPAIERMLQAIALMLTEATKKPAKKNREIGGGITLLAFPPQDLYEACLERVPHIIGCEPYDKRWFGRMGKALQATNGLGLADLESFIVWVENGGLDFFSGCTFEHVIKHWGNWIVKARTNSLTTGQPQGSPEEYM